MEMTATEGYANVFTVCKRSRSPSSVIRLAGDRRMPPSPAGGRKGRLRIRRTWRLTFGAAAEPATGWTPFPTRRCFHASMETANVTTNVLKLWTSLLLFVPFVRGFAAWVFFSTHSCPLRHPPKRYPGSGIFCIARTKSRPALRKSLANPPRLR